MANASEILPFTLRRLPLPVRLTLGMFLVAAGVGYLTGLVQLHFAHASPGNLLPTGEDVVKMYHGQTGVKMTQLERVLEAPETEPFNGSGSMRRAFTDKADDWKDAVQQRPEEEVRKEREGERLAFLQWVRAGAAKAAFDEDKFVVSGGLEKHPLTADFLKLDDGGKEIAPRAVAIKSLVTTRCAGCHGQGGEAEKFPLETYEHVVAYLKEPGSGALPLKRLASLTHTHMMGFAVLFGMTGIIFSLTSFPALFRGIFAPWVLFFQVIDIAFWWLGRVDPIFAELIRATGGLVGFGLALQIVCSLWDLFRPVRA